MFLILEYSSMKKSSYYLFLFSLLSTTLLSTSSFAMLEGEYTPGSSSSSSSTVAVKVVSPEIDHVDVLRQQVAHLFAKNAILSSSAEEEVLKGLQLLSTFRDALNARIIALSAREEIVSRAQEDVSKTLNCQEQQERDLSFLTRQENCRKKLKELSAEESRLRADLYAVTEDHRTVDSQISFIEHRLQKLQEGKPASE